jgi:hypothetical protein
MPVRKPPPARVVARHRRIIEDDLRSRRALEEAQLTAARTLARHVVEAKEARVPHHEIADWIGLTRDGLTKFVNRHSGGS